MTSFLFRLICWSSRICHCLVVLDWKIGGISSSIVDCWCMIPNKFVLWLCSIISNTLFFGILKSLRMTGSTSASRLLFTSLLDGKCKQHRNLVATQNFIPIHIIKYITTRMKTCCVFRIEYIYYSYLEHYVFILRWNWAAMKIKFWVWMFADAWCRNLSWISFCSLHWNNLNVEIIR